MKYERIARALYAEPALITPAAHDTLKALFEAHMAGGLQAPRADDSGEEKPEAPAAPEAPETAAVVWLKGVMMQYASGMDEMCIGAVSTSRIRAELRAAWENPAIQTIFLMIDSPGGQVAGTMETADLVRRIAAEKNVIGIVVGQACSAAYWVASQCTALVSQPSSIAGSIGAYIAWKDTSEKMAKEGEQMIVFRAGKHKAAGIGRPLTEAEMEQYQTMADQAHEDFKAAILEARPDVPLEAMEGQPFTAKDALRNNLVDALVMDVTEFMRAAISDPAATLALLSA